MNPNLLAAMELGCSARARARAQVPCIADDGANRSDLVIQASPVLAAARSLRAPAAHSEHAAVGPFRAQTADDFPSAAASARASPSPAMVLVMGDRMSDPVHHDDMPLTRCAAAG
jgi:hypothetical protein